MTDVQGRAPEDGEAHELVSGRGLLLRSGRARQHEAADEVAHGKGERKLDKAVVDDRLGVEGASVAEAIEGEADKRAERAEEGDPGGRPPAAARVARALIGLAERLRLHRQDERVTERERLAARVAKGHENDGPVRGQHSCRPRLHRDKDK